MSVSGVLIPPLAITLTTSTRRSTRCRTAACSSSAPAASPPRYQQCPRGVVIGGPEATIHGNPSSWARCASRTLQAYRPVSIALLHKHSAVTYHLGYENSTRLGRPDVAALRHLAGHRVDLGPARRGARQDRTERGRLRSVLAPASLRARHPDPAAQVDRTSPHHRVRAPQAPGKARPRHPLP